MLPSHRAGDRHAGEATAPREDDRRADARENGYLAFCPGTPAHDGVRIGNSVITIRAARNPHISPSFADLPKFFQIALLYLQKRRAREEIDLQRAKEALARAEKRLARTIQISIGTAPNIALQRADRIQVASKRRSALVSGA